VPTAGQLVRSQHGTDHSAEAIDEALRQDALVNQY
jgi:hypothetical protein